MDAETALGYYENATTDYQSAADLGHEDAADRANKIQKVIDALNEPTLEAELRRVREENRAYLDQLLKKFESGELEAAAMLLEQDEYQQLIDSIASAFFTDATHGYKDNIVKTKDPVYWHRNAYIRYRFGCLG